MLVELSGIKNRAEARRKKESEKQTAEIFVGVRGAARARAAVAWWSIILLLYVCHEVNICQIGAHNIIPSPPWIFFCAILVISLCSIT